MAQTVVDQGFLIGGVNLIGGYGLPRWLCFKILYVKMKGSLPLGGMHWTCPLDPPMTSMLKKISPKSATRPIVREGPWVFDKKNPRSWAT